MNEPRIKRVVMAGKTRPPMARVSRDWLRSERHRIANRIQGMMGDPTLSTSRHFWQRQLDQIDAALSYQEEVA